MHVDGHAASAPTVTLEALADRATGLLRGPGHRRGRAILGIAGPPAAGKSTLAGRLVAEVVRREGPGSAAYLPLDGFHLSNDRLDELSLRHRKGAPETFDAWGYAALLQRVAIERFHPVYAPDFDRELDGPVAARHAVLPSTRLVITEGNYLAAPAAPWQTARELLDELWYIETDDAVRHSRLLTRHLNGGQDRTAAKHRIDSNDHPNGEYVKAGRAACTWVLRVGDLPLPAEERTVP